MRFDLHRLIQPEGVTFRHWEKTRHEVTTVTIPVTRWEQMGRPVSVEANIEGPAQGWFLELNAFDDPTIWDGDEPVLSRSDVPAHWDELVARLGIAP